MAFSTKRTPRVGMGVGMLALVGGLAACGAGTSGGGAPDVRVSEAGFDSAGATETGAVEAGASETASEASAQCPDMDDDGHGAAPCGDDCDDNDRRSYPGAREVCDGEGRDEDCNPCTVGESSPGGVGGDADQDEDGYPSNTCFNRIAGEAMPVCGSGGAPDGGTEPAARVAVDPVARETRGTDCNDRTRTRNPAASEVCDSDAQDENCDGQFNEGCECPTRERPEVSRRCLDAQGVCAGGTQDCVGGRWSMCSIAPAEETCNERDDDCDGLTDEDLLRTFYRDVDGDGIGTTNVAEPGAMTRACTAPEGYVIANTDCDDTRRDVNPGAREVCNNVDDDCDGETDEEAELACAPRINATNACVTGRCTMVCNPGFADCNGSPEDGCEANLNSDVANCGACGTVCPAPSMGTAGCMRGACGIGCNGALSNCGGACVDLTGTCTREEAGRCSTTGSWVCAGTGRSCSATATTAQRTCYLDCDGDGAPGNRTGNTCGTCAMLALPSECGGVGVWRDNPPGTALDCNDMDRTAATALRCFTDSDGDGHCAPGQPSSMVCAATCPARSTASCLSPDDCNDGDGAAFSTRTCFTDSDRDGHCPAGHPSSSLCVASCPTGTTATCNAPDDCNDSDGVISGTTTCYLDADNDRYCVLYNRDRPGIYMGTSMCVRSCPSGTTPSCAGADCRDSNRFVTSDCNTRCSQIGSYPHCCCLGCVQPNPWTNSVSTNAAPAPCPAGYSISSCSAVRINGGGPMSASASGGTCFLTQGCNLCEGSTAAMNVCCSPN